MVLHSFFLHIESNVASAAGEGQEEEYFVFVGRVTARLFVVVD